MTEKIKNLTVQTQIVVAWGEMDVLQHVNNVVYFRYFETARINFLRKINLIDDMQTAQVVPVIGETSARYRRPVTFPDTLLVEVSVGEIKSDRFMLHYAIQSQAQQALTTTGSSLTVMFNPASGTTAQLTQAQTEALKLYLRPCS